MNICIVEDERVAARRLKRLTKEIMAEDAESIYCLETLVDSMEFLKKHKVDLLLLDLNLSGQDGFDLLKMAMAESFQTIIVSANTDKAIEAYEYGVLDFVPKPFDKNRLMKAFERLEYSNKEYSTEVLVVKNYGQLQLIPVENVDFIKGAGDYSEIHTKDQKTFLHNKSLETLESLLPSRFVRIHKSYILDLELISNILIHGGGKYECKLQNGTRLPISRTRYKKLSAMFEKP